MKNIFKTFYYGYGILSWAAFINLTSKQIGLKSWYDIMNELTFKELDLFNKIWLLFLYPILLGMGFLILSFLNKKFLNTKNSK